ncbi:MAG: 2-oxoacid:acceptor oxidoreductase subunit alpha [Gammaproteobacteria bacterium]|nr:2-oxoacid:acceptor oxidoreductase subunit alpha [Gammaproteobacteria bacterium]
MAERSISIMIAGSGGAGAMTAGAILLDAAARAGWYGLMERSYGPQIRGGEALAIVRLSNRPVATRAGTDQILVAIDWKNIERFLPEFRLTPDSLIIGDTKMGEIPHCIQSVGAREYQLPLTALAKEISGGRQNMIALGAITQLIGLPDEIIVAAVEKALARKDADAQAASNDAVRSGMAEAADLPQPADLPQASADHGERWSITGNEAAAYGAVEGGIRFAAGYPITPATEVLEWLATALPEVGGTLLQAEDELASVGQIIGASFGGAPAMTATSGPGLALMTESIGLAVAAEVPIVVLDVMRGGPSTGIPTKSEQTDLNMAVYGLHGDAPHLVLAPMSVSDCIFTMQWSVHLAETLQTPAIVLSDQSLGQTRTIIDAPPAVSFPSKRKIPEDLNGGYQRYEDTKSGVSPMSIPGMPDGQYTADGLEHNEKGHPSTTASDHVAQLSKRQRKIAEFDFGSHWAEIEGHGETAIITWGSVFGAVHEAVSKMSNWQDEIRLIGIRLLAPHRPKELAAALQGAKRILVVEQSMSGQFYDYLRAKYDLPTETRSLSQPGPLPIAPATLYNRITEWN